jgi:hypothetical protein
MILMEEEKGGIGFTISKREWGQFKAIGVFV